MRERMIKNEEVREEQRGASLKKYLCYEKSKGFSFNFFLGKVHVNYLIFPFIKYTAW